MNCEISTNSLIKLVELVRKSLKTRNTVKNYTLSELYGIRGIPHLYSFPTDLSYPRTGGIGKIVSHEGRIYLTVSSLRWGALYRYDHFMLLDLSTSKLHTEWVRGEDLTDYPDMLIRPNETWSIDVPVTLSSWYHEMNPFITFVRSLEL